MGRTARVGQRPSCYEVSLAVRGQDHTLIRGDTNVFYPHIKKNRPWDIEEMDWYDLREHANTMSDFIQKLYNYI